MAGGDLKVWSWLVLVEVVIVFVYLGTFSARLENALHVNVCAMSLFVNSLWAYGSPPLKTLGEACSTIGLGAHTHER